VWYNAIREVIGVFCHEKIIKVYMSIAEGGQSRGSRGCAYVGRLGCSDSGVLFYP